MSLLANILCILAVSTFGAALQGQPSNKKPSFCGSIKPSPSSRAPDCKHELSDSCLFGNNTCSQMPNNMTFITVSVECSCDLYYNATCTGDSAQSHEGVGVTDVLLYGPVRYYKCQRLDEANRGERMLEVGIIASIFGTVLAVVLLEV